MEQIILKNPLDMHLHLREGEILKSVIKYTAEGFVGALAMPNLKNPINNVALALQYKNEIIEASNAAGVSDFTPIMSLYLSENLNIDELKKAKESGIRILKLYPKGATTGSENGVSEILDKKSLEIFEMAENLGFILSIHGESRGFCMDREFEFGEVFREIASNFPKLKIIMEHLSDRRSIGLLEKFSNLFATLTLHHITLSLDDVLGGGLNPHYFCKPMLKTPQDSAALLQLALEAHPKVSFGSDSAPHLESAKLKQNGAAGIFNAPVLLPKLCEIFERHNKMENLQKFISDNAFKIYDLGDWTDLPSKEVRLTRSENKVATSIPPGIIPLFAGESLAWKIV